jgi:hypothetical protein
MPQEVTICLIISCEPTRKLPQPTFHSALRSAIKHNPDGIGVMWTHNGSVRIKKAVKDYEPIIQTALDLYDKGDNSFSVHLRYNTVGHNSIGNTHPFRINDRIGMMHNKTLWIEPPCRSWSDTRTVAELLSLLCQADRKFFDSPLFYSFIEHHAGTDNRFVFLDAQLDQLVYINQDLGTNVDGVWFSNLYAWDCKTVGLKKLAPKYGDWRNSRKPFKDSSTFADNLEWDSDDIPLAWGSDGLDRKVLESAGF